MTPGRDRRLTLLLILAVGSLASVALSAPAGGNVHRARQHKAVHHARHRKPVHHAGHCASRRRRPDRRHLARCARRSGEHKGSAPLNSSPPTISGSPVQGQTLSASPGSWTGTTPVQYAYQWQRSGTSVPGATATSYALSVYDVGYRIDVVVTASNSLGSTSATSASTAPVSSSSSVGEGTPPPPPAPAITAISPSSGPEAGGTSVAITGSNFDTATAVRFGSSGAVGFTVNSASSITATSPAGSGVVDVTVTNSGGSSASGSADRFSYLTPAPPPPPPPAGAAGEVHFVKTAGSSFDSEDIETNGAWIREHFARMVTFSPFFDSRTSWYPTAWVYQDDYAIYVSSALA